MKIINDLIDTRLLGDVFKWLSVEDTKQLKSIGGLSNRHVGYFVYTEYSNKTKHSLQNFIHQIMYSSNQPNIIAQSCRKTKSTKSNTELSINNQYIFLKTSHACYDTNQINITIYKSIEQHKIQIPNHTNVRQKK